MNTDTHLRALLDPVDTDLATAELASQEDPARPRLSDEAQAQLAASYRRSREIHAGLTGDHDLTRQEAHWAGVLVRRGQEHAGVLVESCYGLVWSKLKREASSRLGASWFAGESGDLSADARAFVLGRAADFDPAINPSFSAFLSGMVDPFISDLLREKGRSGTMPAGWERTLRMVSAIIRDERAAGREPGRTQIVSELEARHQAWGRDRLSEDERGLSPALQKEAIRRRLSKQGMLSALRDVDSIITLARGELRLDAPVGEEGDATVGDLYAADNDVESAVFSEEPESALDVIYAVALGDHEEESRGLLAAYYGLLGDVEGDALLDDDLDEAARDKAWTLNRLSAHSGLGRTEVRGLLRERARARLSAPHAQFAHMAPRGELVFEEAASTTMDMVRSLPRESFADW